ncbi:MAG TPA: DUF6184 family natural product biosynthesis lipoprotein [Polyangia bacterium]|nr:DUF6184 family natural product biosynthesis lipoprotein [Polyangia bacterium]
MTKTAKAPGVPAGLALLAIATVGFLFGHGCGSVSHDRNDRDDAIDQATTATCSRYQACGLIGAAATASYASAGDCQAAWKDKFTTQWTQAQCQGHIDQPMLTVCLDAISGTSCTSILDVLTTFYVKCGAASVCDVPPDGGTRG